MVVSVELDLELEDHKKIKGKKKGFPSTWKIPAGQFRDGKPVVDLVDRFVVSPSAHPNNMAMINRIILAKNRCYELRTSKR